MEDFISVSTFNNGKREGIKMRKGLFIVVGVLLVGIAFGSVPAFSGDTYKIGAVLATGGRFAFLGDPEKKGVELAVDEINAAGGILGKKLEIVFYNDEGNPGKTANLVDRLIKKDKVVGVIGASTSGTIHVVATNCEMAKVPQFYISGNSSICSGKRFVFNAAPADELDAATMVDFLRNNLKIEKLGIIHDANEYGTRSAESFTAILKDREPGIKVVGMEKYQSGDRDMTAQLTNLKNAESECIVIWGVGFAPAVIVKNWNQLGMKKIKLMGGAGMGSHKMIKVLGPAGEGLLFNTVLNYGDPNVKEKEFIAAYQKKFKTVPPTFAAVGYDAAYLLAEGIKLCNGDTSKLSEAIRRISGFEGVQGTFTFAPDTCNGLLPGCYVMAVVKDGSYYPAEKVYPKK